MPKFQITNTENSEVKEVEAQYLRPASILPVPYISQIGPGANKYQSDCGAACCTMILKAYSPSTPMTVDRFYDETGVSSGFLSVDHLRMVLRKYGINTTYEANLDLWRLFELLRQQKPVIVLYKYAVAVDAKLTERADFRSAHFALAVGMDNRYVYIHDPYCSGENGAARPYPLDVFLDAWNKVGQDPKVPNPLRAALYPQLPIGTQSIDNSGSSSKNDTSSGPEKLIYKIRVIVAGYINIRSGPGVNFVDIGDLYANSEREVYEEKVEPGTFNTWGRISKKGTPEQWVLVRQDTAIRI